MKSNFQHIFKALGAFDYAAVAKLISKSAKAHQSIFYQLSKLTHCETSYSQIQFLRSRWFVMRKDSSLEIVYSNIANELLKEKLTIATSTTLPAEEKEYLSNILDALINFCQTRREMILLYQSILAQSLKGEFADILLELEAVQTRILDMGLSKDLELLGLSVEKEITILTCLIRARIAITRYSFQDACLSLFEAKQEITEWKKFCLEQEYPEKTPSKSAEAKETSGWRFQLFGQLESKAHHKQEETWPNTIKWHTRVLGNLTSKMALYFNTILLEKEAMLNKNDPEKTLWTGLSINYHEQIAAFRKKFGAYRISLVYEVTDDTPFFPQGYACPDTPYEAPQGIHSFPFIYSHPQEHPFKHLPNIISIIQGSKQKLSDPKAAPVHFLDNTINSTYYLMRIDRHAVFIIIFLDKHVQRESNIIDFITHIVTSLRGSTVIEELMKVD
ncbi:hypothetical protein BDF20DRAFT_934500 [Mycotypha africana]|uniref:uncharacterized protein n=1 Tax=Mycotypha africana TaxID=64632 RepID=UPI00230071D3|nr:uncharacterized protein BDF20DRAFT_934500 [Mycotypha africana]KAI8984207.1 hypothetical protein BDF20DRAFT_934500 [Mycotypha africana]